MNIVFRTIVRIFLFLLFFEGFLQLGGFLFLSAQNLTNFSMTERIPGKKNYTVLCLGDSITAYGNENSYPKLLEKVLNRTNTHQHFKVINKGIPARTSADIVSYLKLDIEKYNPDIIIVMMGSEDFENSQKKERSWKERVKFVLLEKFKIFRFIKRLIDPLRPDLNERLKNDTIGRGLVLGDNQASLLPEEEVTSALPMNQTALKEKLKDPDSKVTNTRYELLTHLKPFTINSFNDFAEITLSMGRKLIITQYPLLSIKPLESAVKFHKNVFFVENKRNFENAIRQSNREEYFVDLTTPVFGHCTPKGYQLIAENLASTVLFLTKGQRDPHT